jgi:hypothetical protein
MSGPLIVAYHTLKAAREHLDDTMRAEYPIGAPVAWLRRLGNIQRGAVVAHGMNGRVRVMNAKTGAAMWIKAYDIIAAYVAEAGKC